MQRYYPSSFVFCLLPKPNIFASYIHLIPCELGTSSTDLANGVATDSSGNVYVTGGTYGGLDGNTNTGNSDLFVVKYNSSGTKQWTKQLGSSSRDYDYGVATDSSGNVYVAGDK